MITDYIRKNFHWCVIWGIILQCLGGSISQGHKYLLLIVFGWLILLAGTVLLLIGFAFYARSKGRNPRWCLLALLSIIGWILLILLKDKTPSSLYKETSEGTGCV